MTAQPATQAWQGPVRLSVGLLVVLTVVAGATRSGLSWDGSYILFTTLHDQQPFITHARLGSVLLLEPLVALSWITDNLVVLSVVFSLLMAAVLPLSLWWCWRMVRHRQPDFILWPAVGICLLQLPGQFFFASEALIATTLMWVAISWIAVGCPRRGARSGVSVAVVVALLHPLGGVLLLAAGLGLAVQGWRATGTLRRNRWLGAAAFTLVAALRLVAIESNGYESHSSQPQILRLMARSSVLGLPLVLVISAGLLAVTLALLPRLNAQRAPTRGVRLSLIAGLAMTLLACAAAGLAWAAQPGQWTQALDYRSIGPLLAGVLMTGALLTSRRPLPPDTRGVLRVLPAALALISLLVISTQGLWWSRQLQRIDTQVSLQTQVCDTWPAAPRNALTHWSIAPLSLLLQSRQPQHVLVYQPEITCQQLRGEHLQVAPYRLTQRPGWFSLPQP